ncbi:hypothetical protein [Phenylobacterium sp. 58.2.17]|uniref:hypothetical protein n=1 Tax=Phenylobacterium sp. 58.2.17 TaxID=2969306 RepID=UPI002263D466|nr:hypothetical protein [Phenylobacterium sp. 58.2.17]MCX7588141.1 hypothetical protein [Phenylobacterium sp. 58.2.17]
MKLVAMLIGGVVLAAAGGAVAGPASTAALDPAERLEKNRTYLASAPNPDQDGDGRINFGEWLDKEWRYLLSWDMDGDQRLSMAEYIAVFCVSAPGVRNDAAYAACEASKRADFGGAGRRPGFKITRELYAPVARRSFARNDLDEDGYLLAGRRGDVSSSTPPR